ncbi:MAG: hypothetical protein P1P89_18620 [Desulfobacterales bacterium]|nr:hypothetical protein [Desulfobacterales bacterium]
MSFKFDNTLEQFVRRFFECSDAEMEKSPEGLEVLLPEHLAVRLNTPEYFHIATGEDAEERFVIHYGSPLLEKIVDAACETAPMISCRLDFNYMKSQGFDRLIQDRFVFYNCVGRVKSIAEVRTAYLLLTCRYLAQSDEQKEGLVALAFNLETGAAVAEMGRMFDTVERIFETDSAQTFLENDKIKAILTWVQRRAGKVLEREIEPFQDSMNRRFRRDVANLEEYYEDLKQEMEESLKRPGISDQLKSDRKAKINLIPDELERKKADLFKKYSIRVKLELCGGIQIRTPAVKVLYETSYGRKQKQLSLIYNPVTKSMDPLVCDGCGDSTFTIRFCDRLHLLCPACSAKCPVCSS